MQKQIDCVIFLYFTWFSKKYITLSFLSACRIWLQVYFISDLSAWILVFREPNMSFSSSSSLVGFMRFPYCCRLVFTYRSLPIGNFIHRQTKRKCHNFRGVSKDTQQTIERGLGYHFLGMLSSPFIAGLGTARSIGEDPAQDFALGFLFGFVCSPIWPIVWLCAVPAIVRGPSQTNRNNRSRSF